MKQKDYIGKLESIIRQMIVPLCGIPLSLVIESISGHKILPFNPKNPKDKAVLEKLKKVAKVAGKEINARGILRSRPNEVGNEVEIFVKKALNKVKYKAGVPVAKNGKKKPAGYPDIEFQDEFGRVNYLECKTFNISNIFTSQRSFYLSPSENFKITRDAHHFVLSFEILEKGKRGNKNIYNCRNWKLLSLEKLEVDVKYEFNADNTRLYAEELILAEGKV